MTDTQLNSSVLIVDDDKPTIELLDRMLKNKGFSVGTAGNGRMALELLKEKRFDIIITDLMMPEINGYQLLDIIKTSHRDHKVLVMSANLNSRESFLRRGALEAFAKPFDLGKFIEELNVLLRERRKTKRFLGKQGAGIHCTIRDKDKNVTYEGLLIDISIDGALMEVKQKVKKLGQAEVTISMAEKHSMVYNLSGRVVRISKAGKGASQIGIYFDDDRDLKLLDHLESFTKLKGDEALEAVKG